ncbi:MAG: protein kinase domain-containing protein, partial [Myxococcota bacterium]
TSATASSTGSGASIEPGTTLGGRFVVERTVREDAVGRVLAARDQKTGKAISLRIVGVRLIGDAERGKILREECRAIAGMAHQALVTTYGVGKAPTGEHFVACEWVEGVPLSSIVAARTAEGRHVSLRGAAQVLAQVAEALTKAHEKSSHGALRPGVVWVADGGRVKVGDFGVGRAVVRAAGPTALGDTEQACLAPEVKAGQVPDRRSDVFGLGALLYEMLTGRSPADAFVPPSQVHPEATPAVDEVLMTCLAPDPDERFESPRQVAAALTPLVEHAPAVPPEQDFGVGADLEVEVGSLRPAAPPADPKPAAVKAPSPSGDPAAERPQVGARVSVHEPFRPSLADPPAEPAKAAEVDLSALLSKITENDAPRWMVVKDRLDHGPFSGRELVQLILSGEVLGEHGLLNMDTGERKKVEQWTDFTEFVQQYRVKKRQEDHKRQLEQSEKAETRSNLFKIGVAAAVVGVGLLGGLTFLLTREAAQEEDVAEASLVDLYDRGEVEIEGTAGVLPAPRAGGRRGPRSGGSGGSGMSYEQAMNEAVEMGDVKSGGGEQQLSPSTVAQVMNKHVNKFFGCVSQELRGGGSLGKVQIDLAIAGSGKVLGASVRPGSSSFQSCVAAKARSVRFPSFSAPRMGARYSFSVD